jgi:hypothetical protein
VRHMSTDRRQHSPHDIFPRHSEVPHSMTIIFNQNQQPVFWRYSRAAKVRRLLNPCSSSSCCGLTSRNFRLRAPSGGLP